MSKDIRMVLSEYKNRINTGQTLVLKALSTIVLAEKKESHWTHCIDHKAIGKPYCVACRKFITLKQFRDREKNYYIQKTIDRISQMILGEKG